MDRTARARRDAENPEAKPPPQTLRVHRQGWLEYGLAIGVAMSYGLQPEDVKTQPSVIPGGLTSGPWDDADLSAEERETRLLAAAAKTSVRVEFVGASAC